MKLLTTFLFSALMAMAGTALAGTPGITGSYSGDYKLNVKTTSGALMAVSYKSYHWVWNFDSNTATFNGGYIRSPMSFIPLKYATHPPVNLTDNGDGTYTADYVFQAYNHLYGNPQVATATTFEITQTNSGLEIITQDSNGDGIPGTPIYGIFPYDIELDWYGSAN